jgi:hypothetical protein
MGEEMPAEEGNAETSPSIDVFTCPHCQREVAVDAIEPHPFITCPYCGGEFAIPRAEPEEQEDSEARRRDEEAREAELDGMKIKQIAAGRRAAIRARSYFWVAMGGCIGVVGELIHTTYQRIAYEHKWDAGTLGFVAGAIAALYGATHFYRHAKAISDELKQPLLRDPQTPPDFSTLSDGTQRWKNLDEMK